MLTMKTYEFCDEKDFNQTHITIEVNTEIDDPVTGHCIFIRESDDENEYLVRLTLGAAKELIGYLSEFTDFFDNQIGEKVADKPVPIPSISVELSDE